MGIRVYELARELGVSSKEVLEMLRSLGAEVKSHASAVEEEVASRIRAEFSGVARGAEAGLEKPLQEREVAREEPAREAQGGAAPSRPLLRVARGITVKEFAEKLGKSPSEVLKTLISMGELLSLTQSMSDEAIAVVAAEYGIEAEIVSPEEEREEAVEAVPQEVEAEPRPPVVTVMGHVDHGKTLLLDTIRRTNVAAREAGGITQHIGAYQVRVDGRAITFIDTPGHEAFTALRARGAQVTDVAVLVVAADDGVMPQTVEAINHARAAGVPILVAVNKVDKPEADPQKVRRQLADLGLVPQEWGGDTIFVDISAKMGWGLEDLLTGILLLADELKLAARARGPAKATAIEAHLDRGRGPVASVIVREGVLRVGDAVVCGTAWGRVRALLDENGRRLSEAGPGTPVQVLGFTGLPSAGDEVTVVEDERQARQIAQSRAARLRAAELVQRRRPTLVELLARKEEVPELALIIKADTQGSLEALEKAFAELSREHVRLKVLHRAVGAITESDVALAAASGAVVVGFNVRPEPGAREAAQAEGVDVRTYRVIYEALADVEAALKGRAAPVTEEEVLGRAEVRATFRIPKVGTVAGCYVVEGKVVRGARARLLRDGAIAADTRIASLKRFKDDVREVAAGFECGVGLENYQDIKEGDVIEVFRVVERPRY